jgi:hypothetical protein
VHSRHAKTPGVHSRNYELCEDLADPSFQTKYTILVQLRNGSSARRRSMSIELANFKAFRPLGLGDLFAALTTRTNTELGIQGRYTKPIEALLEGHAELEELCVGLLIT